jgi:7-carboxy-7-deazaguanine synthase
LKIDPFIFEEGKKLPIVEEFYTLQGEGYFMGKAAYFIRIGGCDVGCAWCDTKFSWDPAIHPIIAVDKVIDNIITCKAVAAVITGGEPLMYNLDYLCLQLKNNGIETFIETSGAFPLSGIWDWICLSPKMQQPPLEEIYTLANELKVIIAKPSDINWALRNAQKVEKNCKLYLQPEWSVFNKILPEIINFVKSNPTWSVSLQAHKFMHIP